ncbi:MAG: hypothetical protein HQK54_03005 [Oligoflexales bacterium]|nr:hypothetical protein [Oligoflexales bacterium]
MNISGNGKGALGLIALFLLEFMVSCMPKNDDSRSSLKAQGADDRIRDIKIYYYKRDIIQKLQDYAVSSAYSLVEPVSPDASEGKGEGGFLDDILGRSGEKQHITWPNLPWTYATSADGMTNTSSVHFGIKGDLYSIVEAASETTFSFMYGVDRQIFLVKRSNDRSFENNLIFKTDPATGERKLNVVDGQDFVGMCVYKSNVTATFSVMSSLKLSGNGVSGNVITADELGFTRFSSFFKVQKEDTMDSLSNMCLEVFSSLVKGQTRDDLNLAMLSKLNSLGTSLRGDPIQVIIKTALFGGNLKRIKYAGHHWNVRGADIKAEGKKVTVRGRLQHSTSGLMDNDIDYLCEYDDGNQKKREFDYTRRNLGRGWEGDAEGIIDKICHDANLTFRQYTNR